MRTPLFMLTAAALSLAAATAQAGPGDVKAFLDRAEAQAEARLAAAKVDIPAQGVAVRGDLSSDGRLSGVHVTSTSGSRDTDLKVEQTLNRLQLDNVPPLLGGSKLTLNLHQPGIVQAEAR